MTRTGKCGPRVRHRGGLMALALVASLAATQAGTRELGPQAAEFDGERALAHAAAMVKLGPRPLGSEALEQNRRYIEQELRAIGLQPVRDELVAATPVGAVPMANIIAIIEPAAGFAAAPALLLGGHYDTKLFQGVDFVGANDGASSAAILLELGRVLAMHPPPVPVWLVFFDGEEAVGRWSDTDSTYGSRHMAARLQRTGQLEAVGALVLFDMIGDADLQIPREDSSTAWLNDLIWEAARAIGHGAHFPERTHAILDDHLPFLQVGVDAVDLIDFEYGPGNRYWHAPFDTIDRLSADSFQIVGETVLTALPHIGERLRGRR